MNNFEEIAEKYQETNEKPDKKYSILPTALSLLNPIKSQKVLDLGCGSGFFTQEIAKRNPDMIYGIDNCSNQLRFSLFNLKVKYLHLDIFKEKLPASTLINAPFVLNYSNSVKDLEKILENCYLSLTSGKIIAVVDLPLENKCSEILEKQKKYGTLKRFKGCLKDESKIDLEFFKEGHEICSLTSVYFSPLTISSTLSNIGFKNIRWFNPIVSAEGIQKYGKIFWKDYIKYCELGYVTAEKLSKHSPC